MANTATPSPSTQDGKDIRRLVLVTGASGFVGSFLCNQLTEKGFNVRRAGRSVIPINDGATFHTADLASESEWKLALQNVSVVIHLAARTHVLNEHADDPLTAYRSVNVAGTVALARQAAASGVRRLIFLSSIKVNGDSTSGAPFSEGSPPAPEDAYGVSKREAEEALQKISAETGLESVILRPPLVYGPGVKGNFLRLVDAVSRGWPLPLASVNNSRSLVYVGNLADAILACMDAPTAAGKTYLVSDNEDISTPALITNIARALGKRPRLMSFPPALLMLAASMLGKSAAASRLLGSLRTDSSRIRQELGWQPPTSQEEGLRLTAQWYYRRQNP